MTDLEPKLPEDDRSQSCVECERLTQELDKLRAENEQLRNKNTALQGLLTGDHYA